MSDPDSGQKAFPHPPKDFLSFSGPGVGGSAVWGAPHHSARGASHSWGATRVDEFWETLKDQYSGPSSMINEGAPGEDVQD